MLTAAVTIIVILIAAILGVAATRPDSFQVQRRTVIDTSPEKIFALINNLRSWRSWSPWENIDPELKRRYDGPSEGKGAIYAWEGNNKVGQGRMEITETSAPGKIIIKLDFIKPFEAHNMVEFNLAGKGGSTEVTWTMRGPMPFMSKIMSVFMSMDKLVGKDFEQGLANLKRTAEG
jgi:hypothetical protein